MTKGLGKIQVNAVQTGYFEPAEYAAIIDATEIYSEFSNALLFLCH